MTFLLSTLKSCRTKPSHLLMAPGNGSGSAARAVDARTAVKPRAVRIFMGSLLWVRRQAGAFPGFLRRDGSYRLRPRFAPIRSFTASNRFCLGCDPEHRAGAMGMMTVR